MGQENYYGYWYCSICLSKRRFELDDFEDSSVIIIGVIGDINVHF